MTPERWRKIEEIYQAVVDLDPNERTRRLDSLAQSDESLKAEVQSLLRRSSDADSFLESPVLAGFGDDVPDASFTTWLHEGQRIGRYRVGSPLGEGGMGVVFLAEQEHPRRTVALKIIKPALAKPAMLRRFEHEAHILGRLHHHGIAQIFEAGMAEIAMPRLDDSTDAADKAARTMRLPFFAMEHVNGAPLGAYLQNAGLSIEQKLELAARICDAVQHAHQRGVIHRDLKPANIMIVDDEDSSVHQLPSGEDRERMPATRTESGVIGINAADLIGRPKILDFGVARLTDADVNMTTLRPDVGQLLGTLPYMSPEQAAGDASGLDTRSDIYTLGVTFYEMFSGSLPFSVRGRSIPDAARIIRDEDPTPLSTLNRETRGDIEVIIAKAMDKDPDRRYASAAEFSADLRRHLRDEPILARPATAWRQIYKFGRRNRAIATGAMVALLGIIGGSAFAMWQAIEASAEREAAVKARDEATNQAAIAEAVNKFLNDDLLAAGDPEIGGRDTTVLQVLDDAAAAVEGRFSGQPKVESAIRFTLGRTYYRLSDNKKAETQLRRAYDLRTTALGPKHPDTLESLSALGTAMIRLGRYDEAESQLTQCVESYESTEYTENTQYLSAKLGLGGVFAQQGRLEEAEHLFLEVVRLAEQLVGTVHRTSMTARYMLARVLHHQARSAEAIKLYEDLLEIQRPEMGEEHPHTLRTMNNLALVFKETGRLDEAEPLFVEVLEAERRVLGEDHVGTIITAGNLALVYDERRQYDKAEPLLKEVLAALKKQFGERHPYTLNAMNNLAASYREQGRLDEAEPLWSTALKIQQETLGQDHPSTLISKSGLARIYTAQKRFEEAEEYARQGYEGLSARLGPDHPHTHVSRKILCEVYMKSDRQNEAPPHCQNENPNANNDH
ncbi:MAG: serine/threonine-protein kinase [Phycisphaerales bacterium]|nr:serine/threonine-protein kinase [Phycisphaerales bacterium]